MKKLFVIILAMAMTVSLIPMTATSVEAATAGFTVNHNVANLSTLEGIPAEDINNAKNLKVRYWHTSHGSQLVKGMEALPDGLVNRSNFNEDLFRGFSFSESSTDLGNANWPNLTRTYLNAHPDTDVIMWSWCGQVTWASESTINTYLNNMNTLESEYPDVTFVYMTGHLPSSGSTSSGNTHIRNNQIRTYCQNNNKVLYDFADIETFDLAGNSYLDKKGTDGCDYDSDNNGSIDANWAEAYQNTHQQGVDWYNCQAAHTAPLNGNRKAYAAWWMFAQIAKDDTPSPTKTVNVTSVPTGMKAMTATEELVEVSTTNIANGTQGTVKWYQPGTNNVVAAPTNITLFMSPVGVANNKLSGALSLTDTVEAGIYSFSVTVDGVESSKVNVVVDKTSQENIEVLDWSDSAAVGDTFFVQVIGGSGAGDIELTTTNCQATKGEGVIIISDFVEGTSYSVDFQRAGDSNYEPSNVVHKTGTTDSEPTGWKEFSGGWKYYVSGEGFVKSQWKEIEGSHYFFMSNEYRVENTVAWIGSDKYGFSPDGKMLKGLSQVNGKTYYFDESTGVMAYSQFINDGGKRYFFGSNGEAPTIEGVSYVGSDKYYFNGDGSVALGVKEINGDKYGFNSVTGIMISGQFASIDGKRYFFGYDGKATKHQGFGYVGTTKYFFNGDGTVALGIKEIGGDKYGFNENTGQMFIGQFGTIDGKKYFFGYDGKATKHQGFGYVGTTKYFFNGDGTVALGGKEIDGEYYYFDPVTARMYQNEFANDENDGERHYLGSDGKATKHLGFGYVGSSKYYFKPLGAVQRGPAIIADDFYYFDDETGVMFAGGFKTFHGDRFYFTSSGKATKYSGFGYVGSTKYYFNGDGTVALGTKVINGITYHFDPVTGAFLY